MNEVTITPLGTVSPHPCGNKNGPGFLIEYKNQKILLDCGEGISRLMNFPIDLNNLTIIISHLHVDHYSGLGGIRYASYVYKNLGYLNKKIKVYLPLDVNTIDYHYLISFTEKSYLEFIPYNSKTKIEKDNIKINFKTNPHELKTYSAKIKIDDLTIVYSADTGYKDNTLTEFSKNADLLICESSFLKEQNKKEDFHLYACEAGKIAKGANVKKLLLTHFWPTIDSINYVNEAKEFFKNTEAAEEGKKLVLRRNYENYNK